MPVALPTVTRWQISMRVYPSHQQVAHTGLVRVDLLRRQKNRLNPCLNSHTAQTQTIFFGEDRLKVRSILGLFFFLRKMPTQLNIKLCLSSVNNLSFNIWPQIGYDFHLLLIMLSKYCTGTSTILLRAIFPLCDYYIIQGRGRNASEIKASL